MEHKLSPETSLKNLRATRSLSQSEVAEVIGTNANTISRWERGVTTPSLYYRRKLAEFFEVDPQMLASDVTNKDDETVSHPSYIQTELAPLSTEGAPNAVLDQNINLSR